MATAEQTGQTETGLDVAIRSDDGIIIAWAYSMEIGQIIADAITNLNSDGNGNPNMGIKAGG